MHIHGQSHKAMQYFRKNPAALAVYWIYLSRLNRDNVAWPSLAGLALNTGYSKTSVHKARQWLVEHRVLERDEDYIRPAWRDLDKTVLSTRRNLDKSEYYRPTGTITIDGKTLPLLYIAQNEASDMDDEGTDVPPRRPSMASDVVPDGTERSSLLLERSTRVKKNINKKTTQPILSNRDAWYDCMVEIHNIHKSRAINQAKYLAGVADGKAAKDCALEPPFDGPEQYKEFTEWYKDKFPQRMLPLTYELVQSYHSAWLKDKENGRRTEQQQRSDIERIRAENEYARNPDAYLANYGASTALTGQDTAG